MVHPGPVLQLSGFGRHGWTLCTDVGEACCRCGLGPKRLGLFSKPLAASARI